MITWTKRLLLTCTILGLLATNVLTLTSKAFNAAISGLTNTAMGVQTVSDVLPNEVDNQKKTIKDQKDLVMNRKKASRA